MKNQEELIGIYDENDSLKVAAVWGALGAEAILAQMYPSDISLFLDKMDVVRARRESMSYAKILEEHGVKVYLVRDILAECLSPQHIKREIVLATLFQKAQDIQNEYGPTHYTDYKEEIEQLLDEDIERYGRDRALTLNWKFSLYPPLPMGNLLYARDQMNVLLGKRVRSMMKKDIRKPEVEFYETAYKKLLGENHNIIKIPRGESFEGGDAYIHDKTIFIGTGIRTTADAAMSIYKSLEEEILKKRYKMILVEDEEYLKRSPKEQMLFMHLDTYSNPVGKKQMAVCLSEAKRRKTKMVASKNGKIEVKDLKKSFLDYLLEDNQEIVYVPESEQQTFGCNFLALDNDRIIVPLETNKVTIDGLEKIGKTVIYANLNECSNGYGTTHCMTGQLVRATGA